MSTNFREKISHALLIFQEKYDFKSLENIKEVNEEFKEEEKVNEGQDKKQGEKEEKREDYEECYDDDFFLEEDILLAKKLQEETKIRDYLSFESDTISENSFFNRIKIKLEEQSPLNLQQSADQLNSSENVEDVKRRQSQSERPELNVIHCKATIIDPFCQLSESVIQMPATPYSSFSLYRFWLKGSNESFSTDCTCDLRQNKTNSQKSGFLASFQFQYICPQIKLEPQSGILKAGEVR